MSRAAPPPRLFGIPATRAHVVAVLRRGPSDWCHVGRWDTREMRYEPGSWLKGKLFPQRCDLSPDGRWLCYMAMKGVTSYMGVSRLPWLKALAWWDLGSTWGRGAHFVEGSAEWDVDDPDEGTLAPLRRRIGMTWTRIDQFAVERRRGWTETPDSPERDPADVWDQNRAVRLQKRRPGRGTPLVLGVEGSFAAFREGHPDEAGGVLYSLADGDDIEVLGDVQWADWSSDGRLLVATAPGELQIREVRGADDTDLLYEEDLAAMRPDPRPAPDEATRWE